MTRFVKSAQIRIRNTAKKKAKVQKECHLQVENQTL
jgi:hypothetical protein